MKTKIKTKRKGNQLKPSKINSVHRVEMNRVFGSKHRGDPKDEKQGRLSAEEKDILDELDIDTKDDHFWED